MRASEVAECVILASDASHPQHQRATAVLQEWSTSNPDLRISTLLELLQSRDERVLFYALTTLLRQQLTPQQRQDLKTRLVQSPIPPTSPAYIRTKVGVALATLIRCDLLERPQEAVAIHWNSLRQQVGDDILLRTLLALVEDFGMNESDRDKTVKNHLRTQQPTLVELMLSSSSSTNLTMALMVWKQLVSWIDMDLLRPHALPLLFQCLNDNTTDEVPVLAMECLQELMVRGMDDKVQLLLDTDLFGQIRCDLETVDASPIELVLQVAKFVNVTGLELLQLRAASDNNSTVPPALWSQLLDFFFRCLAYDDIDVSGGVLPLALQLTSTNKNDDSLLTQILTICAAQMKYPQDFQYDHQDEDEAEEEVYRYELRKLYTKLVRANPSMCLEFTCRQLSTLSMPLSQTPTREVEAALRLVYHYCEGIRPPPGMKVVMDNPVFCQLLVAIHESDVAQHFHPQVVALYYETAVRYHLLFPTRVDLLQRLLQAMSGTGGIQHTDVKLRSRSCYLLLRLVKSLVVGTHNNIMRPYVETAVSGIHGLLMSASLLQPDDVLYLFETIGLLLGKTDLPVADQQRYLTLVMTPHVRSIQGILQQPTLVADANHYGEILSRSVAAIAYLSKGFHQPGPEVQAVLLETVQIALAVMEALPTSDPIRNKTMILLQRMILCLQDKLLPLLPLFLALCVEHCNSEDVLDVTQLLNQMCVRYQTKLFSVMDASLLVFLRKCDALIQATQVAVVDRQGPAPPHLQTEQTALRKHIYTVLQHLVANNLQSVLVSPANASSLEQILKTMCEGAIQVQDPVIQKTCLSFFRHLIQGEPVDVVLPFVCQVFLSEFFKCMLDPSFVHEDAMQSRNVAELGFILLALKQDHQQAYQSGVLACLEQMGCPVLEGFRTANTSKEMKECLKRWLQTKQ